MFKRLFKKKQVIDKTTTEVIDFVVRDGNIVSIVNHNSFQTRAESTVKMVMDALKKSQSIFSGTFSIYTGDFPQEPIRGGALYYCTNNINQVDIAVPDFVFDAWPQAGIESFEQTAQKISEKGDKSPEIAKLLWIGNIQTNPNRERLMQIAKEYPHLIDAYDTCVDQHIIEKKDVKYISLEEHTRHKYLLDIEGRGYSGRIKLLLFSKRVLFIQERKWKEYFHFDLIPFVHYIPVKNDLSDLVAQIQFVESQGDNYYTQIAENAYQYAISNLTYEQAVNRMAHVINSQQE